MDRIPDAVGLLTGRLESVLELLGKLLGVVQLQPNMVLPLLRTACQILTVEDLHVLQIKSVGVHPLARLTLLFQPCLPSTGCGWPMPLSHVCLPGM
jgi:hypothetical protein